LIILRAFRPSSVHNVEPSLSENEFQFRYLEGGFTQESPTSWDIANSSGNPMPIERGSETLKGPINREAAPQPRNVQRMDTIPSSGYVLVVDGRMETEYADEASAKRAGEDLLKRFPMLLIQVFDATAKTRSHN
jgi:hypothetical protein